MTDPTDNPLEALRKKLADVDSNTAPPVQSYPVPGMNRFCPNCGRCLECGGGGCRPVPFTPSTLWYPPVIYGQRMPAGWKKRLVSQPYGVIETMGPPSEVIQRLVTGDVTQSS